MTTIPTTDRAYLLLGSRDFGDSAAIPAFGGVALDGNVGVSAAVREDNAELTERGARSPSAAHVGSTYEMSGRSTNGAPVYASANTDRWEHS